MSELTDEGLTIDEVKKGLRDEFNALMEKYGVETAVSAFDVKVGDYNHLFVVPYGRMIPVLGITSYLQDVVGDLFYDMAEGVDKGLDLDTE